MSVRGSERKTMTSDECGSEFRPGCVCVWCERQRGAIGFKQGGKGVRAKGIGFGP